MTMASHPSNRGANGGVPHDQTWDAVETYFECITTCSLDDGACITRCGDQLRENDDA